MCVWVRLCKCECAEPKDFSDLLRLDHPLAQELPQDGRRRLLHIAGLSRRRHFIQKIVFVSFFILLPSNFTN